MADGLAQQQSSAQTQQGHLSRPLYEPSALAPGRLSGMGLGWALDAPGAPPPSTAPGQEAGGQPSIVRSAFRSKAPSYISLVEKLAAGWDLDAVAKARLLGLSTRVEYDALVAGARTLAITMDVRLRVRTLLRIKSYISGIYNHKASAEQRYLRRPQASLEGKAPLDLLKSGILSDLERLLAHIERDAVG
jgi:hypothetical protein